MFQAIDPATGSEVWVSDAGANVEVVGKGCGNGSRVPTLRATDPVLGQVMVLSGDQAYVGSTAFMFLGLPASTPFTLAPGCKLYLDPASIAMLPLFQINSSSWQRNLPLPNVPGLANILVSLQTLFAQTDAPNRVDFSNALYLNLGL